MNLIDCLTLKYLNIKFESHLTISTLLIPWFVDDRNPASPAAEKKWKQRLKMSQEKKDTQKEKERLIKNAKCCTETQEESAKCRKTNCDSMMRQRQTETDEQGAKRKKTMQECVSK